MCMLKPLEFTSDFLDDKDKMYDFLRMSKEEFLNFYSYLTEEEYETTMNQMNDFTKEAIKTGEAMLCTFPNDDKNYCHCFTVPTRYLYDLLDVMDMLNERKGVDLNNFFDNYIWDETWAIYEIAERQGQIIDEYEQG